MAATAPYDALVLFTCELIGRLLCLAFYLFLPAIGTISLVCSTFIFLWAGAFYSLLTQLYEFSPFRSFTALGSHLDRLLLRLYLLNIFFLSFHQFKLGFIACVAVISD